MPSIPCNFSPSFAKINRLCAYPMQSRFYCPSFAYCRFSLRGCRKGPPPLPLSSAGGGVYPARKQFVPRLRSMPSALPIHRRRFSPSGDAGRGRRPFRSLPQAGVCTPLGNNLSPVCGQCRRRFRFTAAVPLPPGMPEGAAAPSVFFHRRGRVPRRGAIFCSSGRNDLLSSSISSVPKTSAEGKSLPIRKTRCTA